MYLKNTYLFKNRNKPETIKAMLNNFREVISSRKRNIPTRATIIVFVPPIIGDSLDISSYFIKYLMENILPAIRTPSNDIYANCDDVIDEGTSTNFLCPKIK